jgi:hypothetical protein
MGRSQTPPPGDKDQYLGLIEANRTITYDTIVISF